MQHAAALSDGPRARTAYTNGEVGVLLFLATEVMLFAGLVSAVLVLRSADPAWSAGRALPWRRRSTISGRSSRW